MFCPKCATDNQNEAEVCIKCGNPLQPNFQVAGATGIAAGGVSGDTAPGKQQDQRNKPAGFWVRLMSAIIDGIIVNIAGVFVWLVVGFLLTFMKQPASLIKVMSMCAWAVTAAWYEIWMIGKYGQTLGKMVFGIKVMSDDGYEIGHIISFARYAGKFLNMLTFGIGYLIVLFKQNKRGLHDIVADTKVVYIKKPSMMVAALTAAIFMTGVLVIIGIITAIALPKFLDLQKYVSEGKTKGGLGMLRSALNVYYGDNSGIYPVGDPTVILAPAYVNRIPTCECDKFHEKSNEIRCVYPNPDKKWPDDFLTDSGKWLYAGNRSAKDSWGCIIIDCTHVDKSGHSWSSY
jgi:uncharacterized RDD family membrane protein YckC/type II secretory pathway pseudopilin PulG